MQELLPKRRSRYVDPLNRTAHVALRARLK